MPEIGSHLSTDLTEIKGRRGLRKGHSLGVAAEELAESEPGLNAEQVEKLSGLV